MNNGFIFRTTVLCCMLSAVCTIYADVLCVTTRDSYDPSYFDIAERPKISFEDSSVVISANGKHLEYPLSNYVNISFIESTDISQIQNEGLKIKIEENQIKLSGMKKSTPVAVYGLNGRLIAVGNASPEGKWETIGISGTFILRVGNKTIKMMIK